MIQSTCERDIGARLATRLADMLPDWSSMTVKDCRQWLICHDSDVPVEDNPWNMDKQACIELLESICIQCNDDDIDTLRTAIAVNMDDQCLDGIDTWHDAVREAAWRQVDALGIDKQTTYDICLSTGGPSDGFRLVCDIYGNWVSGEYYYCDWCDGATEPLSLDHVEQLAEYFGIDVHLR